MKKKNIKNTKLKKSSKEQISHFADKAKSIMAAHGVFLMFLLAGASLGIALLKARTYLDPVRNEARFEELTAGNTFNKLDYKLVEKLSEALKDTDIKVGQNIDPTRKNPFSE